MYHLYIAHHFWKEGRKEGWLAGGRERKDGDIGLYGRERRGNWWRGDRKRKEERLAWGREKEEGLAWEKEKRGGIVVLSWGEGKGKKGVLAGWVKGKKEGVIGLEGEKDKEGRMVWWREKGEGFDMGVQPYASLLLQFYTHLLGSKLSLMQ